MLQRLELLGSGVLGDLGVHTSVASMNLCRFRACVALSPAMKLQKPQKLATRGWGRVLVAPRQVDLSRNPLEHGDVVSARRAGNRVVRCAESRCPRPWGLNGSHGSWQAAACSLARIEEEREL